MICISEQKISWHAKESMINIGSLYIILGANIRFVLTLWQEQLLFNDSRKRCNLLIMIHTSPLEEKSATLVLFEE
jgi:hypothetical protein